MQNVSKPSGEKATAWLSGRFRGAHLRLTIVYTIILAVILLISSSITYSAFSNRLSHRFERFPPRPEMVFPDGVVPPRVDEVRADLINSLTIVNSLLLIIAAIFSYWLAGVTLEPIQAAYDRQRRFLSDASHELRTPLAILQTDLENERSLTKNPEAALMISSHLEEVERMSRLVSDLLLLSRYDEDRALHQEERVEIRTAVEQAVERLQTLAAKQNVTLVLETTGSRATSGTTAQGPLFQILDNTIKNAIIYNHPQGMVTVSLTSDDTRAHIQIRDTGIGIAKDDLEKIFDRFYRVDASRSRQTGGSGLGLAIVQSGLDRLQGTIDIKSTLGEGTVITLTIPTERAS